MAKPGTDRDGAMVEKTAGKKSKDKISPFTKTPKLDRSELVGKEGKPKSSMKRKLSFTVSPPRNEERDSDTDDSDPGQSSDMWGERLLPPCRIYADKDGPDKKKVKKESGGKKSTPVNILFGYPLSERKQMALLMQMTARDNSPDSTPSHPSQTPPVQKKIPSSSTSRQKDKVNKRNERGETPLHMAAIRGDVKQVKELIELGADVNVKDFAGWTPLHEACNLGYYDVAKVLIGAGAEVNTQGLDDDTPLHDASSSGHKDIVKLLLRHGGNAFQANKRGERPVDVADSQEVEQLLKGEVALSDPEDSSSDSEDPPSVNPSSVDENMEYSDTEKDSEGKSTTAKASSSVSGVDEYEFKDEDEEEDLSKAINDRHILRRELRQREKEEKEQNHYTPKQSNKSEQTTASCKSKKSKSSRVLYCSSDSSGDETETLSERKCSPTRSVGNDTHKTESRTKKESSTLTSAEQKDKGKLNKKKNKSQSKNKENQEVREDGKENSKSILFSSATVSDNSDKSVREEDSFKMSFSPKDDSSVHLFHLSAVKSPKLNHSQTDKQTTPLKQENAKTCVSIVDGSCPISDGVKYNHYTDSDYCTESSSSKGCKHKEKSKHHHKELNLDGDDGSSSPFKDASLSNNTDGSEGAFRKVDKDGKVVKKHKLKHKEKDKYRKEYEADRNRHRQKEVRKDGHRNLEFDREFWKENFFKSDENEEEKCETPGSCSPQKSLESSPFKEEKNMAKDKHSCSNSSKERKPKEERDKDKVIKKEKKEVTCKEERGKDDDRGEGLNFVRKSEDSLPSAAVKEEAEDKPIGGALVDQNQVESSEKCVKEKSEKRPPAKDKEPEKSDKKHPDKEKKIKSEHIPEKSDLHNSTDRWKEREKLTNTSHSPGDKSHKESEKLKVVPVIKKHEETKDKKSKDKLERRSDKDRPEKDHSSSEHRDKEKDKANSEKKGKAPEKICDHSKIDRVKEKDRDSEKRKKDKSKEGSQSSTSSSNLKLLLEEKKSNASESNKTITSRLKEEVMKTPEKDRDRRDRERDSDRDRDRHRDRDRDRDRHKEKDRDKDKDKDKDRSQQNRDNKLSKSKATDSESDRFKSKASTVQKESRPKEKRLVNDDLMQTSFERMLSLKDQEIEQWHKKHLEKIKQKERERLKQRPGTDSGKQKSKDKIKTPSSSNDLCTNKELLRSKSSETPEGYGREKTLKDATSGRTLSLDAKSLSSFGKSGTLVENSLSRSPRPDTERSGIMSRSVSMISVASSEDSCQATMLTPRPTEYDSDLNLDASDSQPPFLQSSLVLQSSRSPVVHDKDTNSLPDPALSSRTLLSSRHASPYLRAILDEDAKSAAVEADRPVEESQKLAVFPLSADEHGKGHPVEDSSAHIKESQSSQNSTTPILSAVPEDASSASVEGEGNTLSSQPECVSQSQDPKDLAVQQTNQPQATSLLLTTVTELSKPNTTDALPEESGQSQLDNSETDKSKDTEVSNKDASTAPTPQVTAPVSAQPQNCFNTKTTMHSSSLQWEAALEPTTDHSVRTETDLKSEQKEKSLSLGPENKPEERSVENVSGVTRVDSDTSSPAPFSNSSRINSEESAKTLLGTASVTAKDSQEVIERADSNSQEDCKSRLSSEPTVTADAQLEKNEHNLPVPLSTNVSTHCASPEQAVEEPMEVSEGSSDSVVTETKVENVTSTEDQSLSQSQSQSLPEAKQDTDVEMPEQPAAVEEKPLKLDPPSDPGDHSQSCSGVQRDPQAEPPSGSASGSSSPLSIADRDSDPSGARAKVRLLEDEADMQVTHPRKRKMPRVSPSAQANLSAQQIKEKTQQSLAAIVDSLKLEEIQPYQTERANPYYEFLHIRKKIEEKRKVLCSVIPQAPQYYDEYVTFNGSYLLDGNPLSKLCIPTITPPPSLPEPLKEMFKQQEVVRMKLRLQHSIEREKLIVSNEQEVLRVHYRAARTLANQTLPFSACTVLLDAEVYNMPQDVQGEDGKTSVRDRFNARQFMSWLQDVDDKFDKLKTCLLMRQQHEAAALNAVQRLEWQLKLQELDPATYKSTSIFEIPEFYIPLVEVNDDFDLTPI
ncbi:ankyrin repeat domain-containing protein 12 isoform X1 [Astyanax mexicanus]|uniref:ankyrin repeat domain-containing protein 12 isoform X1 n=1 Tax=Astyanax mexicanus TaxID=7994 RepID=UPI0020CB5F83|nr:ankyrin repeat domain-containing protein 12 isoform X1 [Astyanax mexicanus]